MLDVGPAMAPVLQHAVRAVSTLLADKVQTAAHVAELSSANATSH